MKLLLLGGTGRLGRELARVLAPLDDVRSPRRGDVDLLQPAALAEYVRDLQPDVIVNAAAYNAVDRAETERDLAFAVNAEAPAALAAAAREIDALLVHYSTDQVFDGRGEAPHDEDDPVRPLNAYGASKLQGEQRVRSSGCGALILRTSWLHAVHGPGFVRVIAKAALERERLDVVVDEIGAPTSVELVAEVTTQLLRDRIEGLYHLTAAGATSRHALAQQIVEWMRARGLPLRIRELRAVTSREFGAPAPRPLNAQLATRRLLMRHAIAVPHWRVGVERRLMQWFDEGLWT
jgi:dTDP-4-dehydrorhamnose reductase